MTAPGWFDDELHDDAVPHDRWDDRSWMTMSTEMDALRDMLAKWDRQYDYSADFGKDAFNLLQKGAPRVRQPEEMNPTRIPLRAVTHDLSDLPELNRLREHTVADAFNAALGMKALEPVLDEALKRAQELKEQAEEAAEALQNASDDPQAQEEAQAALEALATAADAASAQQRSQMREALDSAADEADELADAAASYGVDPGEMKRMSFAERAALAKRLSGHKLREFAKLIGAFRQLAAASARKRFIDGADEVVGVKLGNDLTRLTPPEVVNMAVPELEDDFWLRFATGELLTYELRGREHAGRGPILVVADESGSMAGDGERWAKGLALALLDQAARQGRDFTYIGFASEGDPLRTFSFPKGRGETELVLEMVEGFLNGGTSFDKPLRLALDIIAESGKERPDVVFITDGEAPTPNFIDDWHATVERLSVKVFGIFVSSFGGHGINALRTIAPDTRLVGDLLDVVQVEDILRAA